MIKNTNIELKETPTLFLDDKEIRQLILNLVQNGLDAMPSGGTITTKTLLENENVDSAG